MKRFTNRNGNALILVLVAAGVSLGSLALFVSSVGQYASQVGSASRRAAGADPDAQVLNFVMKKVAIQGKQKSEWFTAHYPSAQEMQADRDADLATSLVTVDSLQTGAVEKDIHVNLNLVRGKLDSAQKCQPISPAITKRVTDSNDCDVVRYKVDASGFGAVRDEKQELVIDASKAPSSIIASPNLGLLSIEDKLALSVPGALLPLDKVMESIPVTFKKRIADPSNPNKLSKFLVSVSRAGRETLALIPVSSPATPSCQLFVNSSQPVRLMQGDQDVIFNIKTDSVASNAKVILPDGTDMSYSNFEPYAMSGYGDFRDLNSSGFVFRIPQTKGLSMIGQPQVTFDPSYPSMQRWNIIARVADLDGNTRDCSTSLLVDYPIDPICNVYASPSNPAPGETTNIVADCSSSGGGPVADISLVVTSNPGEGAGFKRTKPKDVERQKNYNGKNYRVVEKVFEDLPADSSEQVKTFRKDYVRQAVGNEKLTVVIKSLSGREQRHEIIFAQGCPFNDPGHEALLFADKSTFQDSDGLDPDSNVSGENHIGASPDDLIFTMGNKTYTRENRTGGDNRPYTATMRSGSAASVGHGANFDSNYIVKDQYGNLPLYIIKDSDEMCASGHYCMAVERTFSIPLREVSNAKNAANDAIKYNGLGNLDETNILSNRQYFWVEVGLSLPKGDSYDAAMAADGNAVKKDAACRPISTKRAMFRDNGGCFAGSTQVRMADGSDKKVSEVQADDWVLNPLYNAPIKVKKVVKGPEKKSLWEVKYGENRLVVTEDHPFLTKSGWIQTQVLKKGEILIGNGQTQKVTSVKKLKYQAPEDVWNFELDTEDTFGHMVLANGIPTGDLTTQLNLKREMKKVH